MAKIQYTPEELAFKASIQAGDAGAVSIKRTNPPKHKSGALVGQIMKDVNGNDIEQFSIEVAEKLEGLGSEGVNLLEMANPLNPTFKRSGGLRNAWQTVSKEWSVSVFGCDLALLDALPVHSDANQARIYIGKMNPSFTLGDNTVRLRIQIVAKFASEFKAINGKQPYELIHLLGDKGARATAKRAGDGGRFIKGLNPETGRAEHIIERGVVNSDMVTKDGEIIRNWEHRTIAEYTETATDGIPHQLNTATGTVEVANAPLAAL
tara:strand:+ start:229 stop:1020 length:792 start_codon:yes stop_codon:yes gene_type:complete